MKRILGFVIPSAARNLLFATAACVLLSAAPVFAQGCAMCYSNAAGSTKDGQKAISKGVIVLLVPPLGFMTVGMGLAYRYGRRRDQDADINPNEDGEL